MSIMRSFTTRRKQPEIDGLAPLVIGRAASQRGGRPVARAQISGPVALVSTTNMLSYNAPDIYGTKRIEHQDLNSSSNASSSEDTDGSGSSVHSHETDPTDMSSVESSPTSAEPNHLSHYFKASDSPLLGPVPSPMIPRRAPSHSKRAHEALSRTRSVQRARSPSVQTRASADMFTSIPALIEATQETSSAQLDAVVEELGGVRTDAEAEAIWLQSRGLACYAASDYLSEINGLVEILLDDQTPVVPDFSGWF